MWGWVKTYCYHIWRNNYPLASYLLGYHPGAVWATHNRCSYEGWPQLNRKI